MKETYYFQHDYNSRNDLKLIALRSKYKSNGLAFFWTVIEMLHEEESHCLPISEITFLSIADQSGVASEIVKEILNYCIEVLKLFKKDKQGNFFSERVMRNFQIRKSISESRSRSAKLMHQKKLERKSNPILLDNSSQNPALQEQMPANALQNNAKEKKGKKNKVKENKVKENKENYKDKKENNIYFENNELNNKYLEFLEFRNELAKPVTKTAIKEQVAKLKLYDNDTAIKMITNSIVNGYQGIFELKENNSGSAIGSQFSNSNATGRANNSFQTQIKFLKELIEDCSPILVPKYKEAK